MHLYVYYDAPSESAPAVRAAAGLVQAELALPRARLLRRAERAGPKDTWMEVYEGVPAGFEAHLDAIVARHGLAALTGPRHVERFTDVAPCA